MHHAGRAGCVTIIQTPSFRTNSVLRNKIRNSGCLILTGTSGSRLAARFTGLGGMTNYDTAS